MPLTGEAKQAYNRRRYATVGKKERQARLLPFAGVDGEGGDIGTGRQEYLLLRAGQYVLETGKPLTPMECLRFIADLPPDRTYVSYSFNYDVTMILRDLPLNRWARVLDRHLRMGRFGAYGVSIPYRESPIDGDVQVDYLPSKEFKVRIMRGGEWQKYVRIHDTFSFFQTSFLNTITTWLGDSGYHDVIEEIAENKARRGDFGPMTDKERHYNKQECIMLARVMTMFAEKLEQAGIPALRDWQGPGNIAAALFNKYELPKRAARGKDTINGTQLRIGIDWPAVVAFANRSYYGGRFEPCIIGEIYQKIYQYDLRSAYASMYKHLPCLVHGTWHKQTAYDWNVHLDQIGFTHIRFQHPPHTILGAFPVRKRSGTIQFPLKGEGVYTNYEINAALRSGIIDISGIEWLDGWQYDKHCDCVWLHFAEELYKARQRVAVDDPNLGRIFKLALASMYGKLAQSVGEPVYSNPVWAALITGYVRAQLFTAAARVKGGAGVVMLATDGIFTIDPIPDLDIGPNLGQWELIEHEHGMMVIQSGVYLIHGEDGDKVKSRGVPMRALSDQAQAFRQNWTHHLETDVDPSLWSNRWEPVKRDYVPEGIKVTRHMFYGLRLARHLGKPELAGTWDYNYTREVGFNWRTKRGGYGTSVYPDDGIHTIYWTIPPAGSDEPTMYYSKDIGKMGTEAGRQMELLRIEDSEMP
jgi:hypothetical protein